MKLYRIPEAPNLLSMTYFHALAKEGIESLVLVRPTTAYVSTGYFQDPSSCVNFDYCESRGIPVVRREVGGGTVLLDQGQVFFHVVLRRDHPLLQRGVDRLYQVFSAPVIATYERLGVRTALRPVNDIVTMEGKKIAGLGGANIGPCGVFVGSIIMDFDVATMVQCLNLPDEKFRDKVWKSMESAMTTLRAENGVMPEPLDVFNALAEEFGKLLGPLDESAPDPAVLEMAHRLESEMLVRPETLKEAQQAVKIKSGWHVARAHHKAPGGLISVYIVVGDGAVQDVQVTGDFTMWPKEALSSLEQSIKGARRHELPERIESALRDTGAVVPGVRAEDFVQATESAWAQIREGTA
ncbi:MAG: lipoate--protein ligase [Bacillota bacterium]